MNKDEIYQAYPLLTRGGTERCLVIGDDLYSYLPAKLFIKYIPPRGSSVFTDTARLCAPIPIITFSYPKH